MIRHIKWSSGFLISMVIVSAVIFLGIGFWSGYYYGHIQRQQFELRQTEEAMIERSKKLSPALDRIRSAIEDGRYEEALDEINDWQNNIQLVLDSK